MVRFNYIISVHNKEHLIEKVLNAALVCAGRNSHIYAVLDGCTDGTEAAIDAMMNATDGLPITKLYAPDVHEILSLNKALRQVPQDEDGYNILLQDDVVLGDRNLEAKIGAICDHFEGNIGMLSFRHGVNLRLDDALGEIVECDLVESIYGPGQVDQPLLPGQFAERMVAVRSPECISTRAVREIGLMDEKYAPFCYDNHDYSLRCLKAGLHNVVYAMKVRSKVEWGGMRNNPQPHIAAIMRRNRRYCYADHADLIRSLNIANFQAPPADIAMPWPRDDAQLALRRYQEVKRQLENYRRAQRVERPIKWLKSIISRQDGGE